ncbi:MAG: leucine-rich repeat protein [Alistipes sp.]|nr:leucine-rich repeat protein [Alistipes sp.]
MNRFFIIAIVAILLNIGCTNYIDNYLSKRDEQIAKLEELCKEMNSDIESLQALISALQKSDTVTSVTPIIIDGVEVGYTMTFTQSEPITIYHGANGEDGDSFFSAVTEDEQFVYLTLTDGSVITISKGEKLLHNKLYYTTTNGSKLFPQTTEPALFGAILISNTYRDGQGVMTFDDNITVIGESLFYGCLELKSITIPDSVTEIDTNAFRGCSNLTEVTLGRGVKTIHQSAFQDCVSIRSITIPSSVKNFGAAAFYNCNSLNAVHIEDLAEWCSNKFSESNANPLSNGGRLFIGDNEVTHLIVPEGVTEINSFVLDGCTSVNNITIGSSVKRIHQYAFYYCANLESITIPQSVAQIDDLAFVGCSKLNSFDSPFASTDSRCLIMDNTIIAFAPAAIREYTLPEGITTIGDFVFCLCNELEHITLSNTLTTIGDQAFFACESLKEIAMPDSVTNIGFSAFYGCQSLENVSFGRVRIIDSNAFNGCSSLKTIDLPMYVESIGAAAFSGCSALESVYCHPTVPPVVAADSFSDNAPNRTFYVPRTSEAVYEQALGWSGYASAIEPYDFE